MSLRNIFTLPEPQMKFTLVVSLGGSGAVTRVSAGAGRVRVSAGAGIASVSAGAARVSAGAESVSAGAGGVSVAAGFSGMAGFSGPGALSAAGFFPAGRSGGRLGSFLAASSAAFAAASAAFFRYSDTGSPERSLRRCSEDFTVPSGMSHMGMAR